MSSEVETVEGRLTSLLGQLQAECDILDRLVYKNKNQHRRCSYFQYLLKVRRDMGLLQSANLEELVRSCILVIKGDRPKQKVHLLESLKRRKCNSEKYNFMERLLGAARLLAQMVEPMLKGATEISILFARSFFMGFSLTIMALLARLRVLVQQILLDVVTLFNSVSSLSQKKQSIKITQEGIEVFREFFPVSEDFVTLECVWNSDKFVLHERKRKSENASQGDDSGGTVSVQASAVNYTSIESFLGDDPHVSERIDADSAVQEGHPRVKEINTDSLPESSPSDISDSEEGGENPGTREGPSKEPPPEEGLLHASSQSSPSVKLNSGSKKVAFVSIKNPSLATQSVKVLSKSPANAKVFHSVESESKESNNDKGDTLASLLTDVIAKDSLF